MINQGNIFLCKYSNDVIGPTCGSFDQKRLGGVGHGFEFTPTRIVQDDWTVNMLTHMTVKEIPRMLGRCLNALK